MFSALAPSASAQAPGDERRAALDRAWASESLLDERLAEEAAAAGVSADAGRTRLHRLRVLAEVEGRAGASVDRLRAALAGLAVPEGLLDAEVDRAAWRAATAEALLVARRPPLAEAALRAAYAERYGPDGRARRFRVVFVSAEAETASVYGPAEAARDRPAVEASARERAAALLASLADARAGEAARRIAAASAGEPIPFEAAAPRAVLDGLRIGEAALLEQGERFVVALVTARLQPARLRAVKATVLPRPGEAPPSVRARAEAARRALGESADPAMWSLASSDDPDDRRSGGELRLLFGGRADPGASPVLTPADRYPDGLPRLLARLEVGEVTEPIAWRRGYVVARLTGRDPLAERPTLEGVARAFPFDETAIRRANRGPIRGLARARAAHVLERAERGDDLAALASRISDDGWTREREGLVDGAGLAEPELREAAARLAPGEPAALVEVERGFYVIACVEDRAVSFEEASAAFQAEHRAVLPGLDAVSALLDGLRRDVAGGAGEAPAAPDRR